eukprot:767320-Hanusia_phi.AAC.16
MSSPANTKAAAPSSHLAPLFLPASFPRSTSHHPLHAPPSPHIPTLRGAGKSTLPCPIPHTVPIFKGSSPS